ncbi:hypothetical protein [uncultured Hymenobacter sp.]|uniref:hypothetical protein n=1 Tax=uncultured Hymenobacter sp. TaxID=170016 RepID=UPI0035CBEA5C
MPAITLADEIADLKREIKLRERKYPEWRALQTDPRIVAKMKEEQDHQLACAYATLARLETLLQSQLPIQTSLF